MRIGVKAVPIRPEFAVRLYADTVSRLFDSMFMNQIGDLAEWRAAKLKKGRKHLIERDFFELSTQIGEIAIELYFVNLMFSDHEVYSNQAYDVDWLIEELAESFIAVLPEEECEAALMPLLEPYYSALRGRSSVDEITDVLLRKGCKACRALAHFIYTHKKFDSFKCAYALEIADRILHDRQLSYFIAEYVSRFGKRDHAGRRIAKVQRGYWPAQVKRVLISRDRGKCAECGCDLLVELLGDIHIDHIIALSQGGTNDIVNLQLLCARCNTRKGNRSGEITSSIPKYHPRKLQLGTGRAPSRKAKR